MSEDYLEHHGIKGMRWGVRRYRNADGSLTEAGKKRKAKVVSYKEKIVDKTQRRSENFRSKANSAKEDLNDLKKHGTSSLVYKNWQAEKEIEDLKKDKIEGTDNASWNSLGRAILSKYELKELVDIKKSDYERYSKAADSWMNIHDEVMNYKVGDLTTKHDVRKAYRKARATN